MVLNGRLILLFGMPRSGTTWIGKIFDSHPETLYRHEPDSWGRLNAVPLLAEPEAAERYREPVTRFVDQLAAIRAVKVSATLPVFKKRYYSRLDHLLQLASVKGAKAAAKLVGEFPVPLPRPRGAAPILVWKSIESLGRLGALARLYPEAVGIHIMRHPCGYVASVKRGEAKRKFSDTELASEDYGLFQQLLQTPQAQRRGLTEQDLRDMHPVERLAWRWLLYNEKAMEDIEGARNCRTLVYEDVCKSPEGATRSLFEFAGLDWNDQSGAFVGASTASDRDAYYSVYKDPLRAANKWREELSAEEARRIWSVVENTAPGAKYAGEDGQRSVA